MPSVRAATGETAVTVLLTQLTKAIYRHTSDEDLGMRLKGFVALAHLRAHSGITQHELGEAISVDANNLVILLNELEGDGFALRRRDPEDRRRHLVDITAEGSEALEKAEEAISTVERELLGALSLAERRELHGLLGKALDSAQNAART